ncbi:Cysteine protease atg4b [Mortierella sp. 14UC]|nr:Cysteine protease atg4b [Mortierella sp. 14UC]
MDKRPPTSLPLPLLPLEVRPAFSRSKSQQNLTSPTRLYSTVSSALGRSRVDLLSSPSSEQLPAVPPIPVHYAPSPSAFATMQKVYQSSEDMSFWSTLYAQHKVHSRQENQGERGQRLQQQGSPEKTSTAATFTSIAAEQQQQLQHLQQQQHCGEATGSIKVWQVLTKTVLDSNNTVPKPTQELQSQQEQQHLQHPLPRLHFERLPIKVQTSAAALSTNGQPFSIVFFFTVDTSPITLWYLESAFTQSATVHEHMELMGTFQPNNPRDPTSFYIYETHAFDVVQPTQEDTMLDIHVQNPAGTIYAEFSYTFIKELKAGGSTSSMSPSTLSMPNSPRTASTRQEKNSCSSNDTDGITPASATTVASLLTTTTATTTATTKHVEMPLSPVQSPLDGYDIVERESPSSPGYFPVFEDEPSPSYSSSPSPSSSTKRTGSSVPTFPNSSVISESSTQTSLLHHPVTLTGIEQDEVEIHDNDDHEEPEAVFVESLSEEPDAGEHFMQATSEFFSKMGYWLYNSKMIQYIARDERTRIKTLFQTDDIWILGVSYTFDQSEPPLSLHEAPRSRKSSVLQAHAINASRSGGVNGGTAVGGGSGVGESKGSSVGSLSPGSDHSAHEQKRLLERPRSHTVSSPRARVDSDAHSKMSTFSRRQDSSMEPPRSRSKERKLEKQREKELAKEAAKAKKLARAKERELEKEQERQLEREKAKEKARLKELEKVQKFKAKISHPHFDRNNNLDGSRHLSAILALDSKEQGYLNVRREPERKSQSIHGYNHEYRANVGLGLSTDTAEPKQQEGDETMEYSPEPGPLDTSPEHSPPPHGDRPRSARQRLLNLPSALLTNLPRQRSPSSPSIALNKSWKAISPRSPTSRSTLPLVAAMGSPTIPPVPQLPSNPSSPRSIEIGEYPTGILDPDNISETRPDANGISRRDLSSSSRFSTTSHLSAERPVSLPAASPNRATMALFMADFQSRIWFTYRKEIARIEPSFYTSDAGWGYWRATPLASEESRQKYCTILGWFADEPDRYYSIHSIARMGVALDKRVGEWFGPSTVAHALRRLSTRHHDCPLAIMVSMDGSIDTSELVNAATGKENKGPQFLGYGMAPPGSPDPQRQPHQQAGQWKPVVIMMPVRYGLDKLKEGYVSNLKKLFQLPQFLGIAGGRPGRSLYFVACQGNDLFYFDPHTVKTRATQEEMSHCPSSSYHCNVVRAMDIMELDPSMMLGFLIRSMQDLVDLQAQLKQVMEPRYTLLTITGNLTVAAAVPAPTPAPIAAVVEPNEKVAAVVVAPIEKAAVVVAPSDMATAAVAPHNMQAIVVEPIEIAAVVEEPSVIAAVTTPTLVNAPAFGQVVPEKEEAAEEEEEVEELADEKLEQRQMDQKDAQPVKTAVVAEEEEREKEEVEVVEEDEEEIVVVLVSPHDTKSAMITAATTAPMSPNLDAPLPPLPHEYEFPAPAPPLQPVSTSPIESRPKKEMRRITRAFQKEKWMVKPRSSKNKKSNSSPPVNEPTTATTTVDNIIYRYAITTCEEDTTVLHNEDTLSVKSFDSDLSL